MGVYQSNDGRHLSYASLTALWAARAALIVPIQGSPICRVRLDPERGEITLITPYSLPEPDVAGLRHVTLESVTTDDTVFAELTVNTTDNVYGAYSFLAAIADQLQVHGAPLVAAVASAIRVHREVLATRGALTLEKELGLYGELLTLRLLIVTSGVGAAIEAWQGPRRGEHDFVLADADLEVKSTSTERRQHLISSLTQLVCRPEASLYLVSVQLTRTTATTGMTLPALIADTREIVGAHADALNSLLGASGWNDADADLYATHWSLRSPIASYEVNNAFPRLTIDAIRSVVARPEAVSDVSYRLDVTDLEPVSLSVLGQSASPEEEKQ